MGRWSRLKSILEIVDDKSQEAQDRLRSIFEFNKKVSSRPIRFRKHFEDALAEIRSRAFVIGPRGQHGCWQGSRAQARSLARQMARHAMKMES